MLSEMKPVGVPRTSSGIRMRWKCWSGVRRKLGVDFIGTRRGFGYMVPELQL